MKRKSLLLSVCAAALLVPFTAAAEEGKKYQIKLDRPVKAGAKSHEEFRVTIEKSERATFNKGREVLNNESSEVEVELTGEQEVLEVTPKGDVKRISFKVEKFTVKEEKNSVEEKLKPGTVIIVSPGEDGSGKIEVEGKTVEGLLGEILDEILTVVSDKEKHEDEDHGYSTKEPRAAGSEWKVDPKAFLADMPDDMPFTVKAENVKGKAKFPAVKTFNGMECYAFEAAVVMKPDTVTNITEDFKLQKADVRMSVGRLAPADPALPIPMEKLSMRLELTGTITGPDGDVTLTVFRHFVHERISKALK